mmetsp:Transcript_3687/g.13002  ORF Transcript_3687/g.13002 Transcript_3687/m.13002 type:complete len:225 (+) Transcript_3687:1225-1899(+)
MIKRGSLPLPGLTRGKSTSSVSSCSMEATTRGSCTLRATILRCSSASTVFLTSAQKPQPGPSTKSSSDMWGAAQSCCSTSSAVSSGIARMPGCAGGSSAAGSLSGGWSPCCTATVHRSSPSKASPSHSQPHHLFFWWSTQTARRLGTTPMPKASWRRGNVPQMTYASWNSIPCSPTASFTTAPNSRISSSAQWLSICDGSTNRIIVGFSTCGPPTNCQYRDESR